MDITTLPTYWRKQATTPPLNDYQGIWRTLLRCADELDLAYHQDRHDGEFYDGCKYCDWEREHNDHYPELRR